MKINKIINLLIVSLVLVITGCEPIVDELHLKNNTTAEKVELVAIQTTNGGNEITLEMKTPGVTGYWNYFFGKGLTNKITFAFPLTGTFDFKFEGTLGAEFFEKTISVTIDVLDHPVDPEWAYLLGEDPFAGKKWVFDGTGGDNGLWWYMSPSKDPDAWATAWWNAGGTCCPPPDVNGEMHFYFDGKEGIKYDYYSDADASPAKASFELKVGSDDDYGTLRITDGENILGAYSDRKKSSGEYTLISMSDDEIILYADLTDEGGTGWTYIYRPQ